MEITVREFDSLESARETWLDFQEHGELYIFQTYEWLESWYINVGAELSIRPCLVAVYSEIGEPLCFFPFAIERKGFCSLLTWLGAPSLPNPIRQGITTRPEPGILKMSQLL